MPTYSGSTDSHFSVTFQSAVVASMNAVNNYSNFDGNSMNGDEGRWIGFKKSAYGVAIVLYGGKLYYSRVFSSGEINSWQII